MFLIQIGSLFLIVLYCESSVGLTTHMSMPPLLERERETEAERDFKSCFFFPCLVNSPNNKHESSALLFALGDLPSLPKTFCAKS